MPLTISVVRRWVDAGGLHVLADVTFDSSYPTGGETLDLTAAPFAAPDAFTAVDAVTVKEGPYTTAGVPIARTLCSAVRYDFATARAVATGLMYADAEDGTSGVTAQVADTTDLSTVVVRVQIDGR